ncbi:MAG TPA: GAF domain-containing protein, partial [Kofleriaceae bacterium]|nr:GAF domain-containing protein [Kofleriaceae bacterium]
ASGKVLVPPSTVGKPTNPLEARRAQIAFTGSRALASALDLAAAETSAITTVRELLDADRAYFLVYNDADGSLRSPSRSRDDRRAIAGIAGWVAHTGRAVAADRATADARWLAPIDDPDGDPNSQLLVEPVIGADQRVIAVIVAAKRPRRPGFTELDASLAARFAALIAPLLEQLQLHMESQHLIADTPGARDPLLPRSPIEQMVDRVRTLPRWAFAVAGAVLLGAIIGIASC